MLTSLPHGENFPKGWRKGFKIDFLKDFRLEAGQSGSPRPARTLRLPPDWSLELWGSSHPCFWFTHSSNMNVCQLGDPLMGDSGKVLISSVKLPFWHHLGTMLASLNQNLKTAHDTNFPKIFVYCLILLNFEQDSFKPNCVCVVCVTSSIAVSMVPTC